MFSTGNVASLSCDSFPKEQITSIRIICCFDNERIYSLVSLIYIFCEKIQTLYRTSFKVIQNKCWYIFLEYEHA